MTDHHIYLTTSKLRSEDYAKTSLQAVAADLSSTFAYSPQYRLTKLVSGEVSCHFMHPLRWDCLSMLNGESNTTLLSYTMTAKPSHSSDAAYGIGCFGTAIL